MVCLRGRLKAGRWVLRICWKLNPSIEMKDEVDILELPSQSLDGFFCIGIASRSPIAYFEHQSPVLRRGRS